MSESLNADMFAVLERLSKAWLTKVLNARWTKALESEDVARPTDRESQTLRSRPQK